MFGFLRRRNPKPPSDTEPTKPGVLMWTGSDYYGQHKAKTEDQLIREFDQALAPAARYPVSVPRRSIFDRPADPDSFPGV